MNQLINDNLPMIFSLLAAIIVVIVVAPFLPKSNREDIAAMRRTFNIQEGLVNKCATIDDLKIIKGHIDKQVYDFKNKIPASRVNEYSTKLYKLVQKREDQVYGHAPTGDWIGQDASVTICYN